MIQQQLIVLTLRDRLFRDVQSVLRQELSEGWLVKDVQLSVGQNGRRGFMSVLLEREVSEAVMPKTSVYVFPDPIDFDEPIPPDTEDINESDVSGDDDEVVS